MKQVQESRNSGIDLTKILACMGVLALHVYVQRLFVKPTFEFQNILFYLGTLSMPIFFVVNGYLIMRKLHDPNYYAKKIRNIFKIVFTINVLWCAYQFILKGDESISFFSPLIETFKNMFLQQGSLGVFWFFGSLTMIYLMMPFVQKYIMVDKKRLLFLVGILLIIQFAVNSFNFYCGFTGKTLFEQRIYQPLRLYNHLCYFLLGGMLNYEIKMPKLLINKWVVYISVIIATFSSALICNTIFRSYYVEYLHCNIVIIIATILLFNRLRLLKITPPICTLINILTPALIIVYIIHCNLIAICARMFEYQNSSYSWLVLFMLWILCFTIGISIMKVKIFKDYFKI